MGEYLLLWVIAVPSAVGILCWIIGRSDRRIAFWLALLCTIATAVLTWQVAATPAPAVNVPWLRIGEFELSLSLRHTPFSGLLAMLCAGFAFLLVLYSKSYVSKDMDASRYYAYMMWTLAGALTAFYADHLLILLIGWEVVTVMLFLLVSMGGTEEAAAGGMKSFVLLGLSDCAMLASIATLWATDKMPTLLLSKVPDGGFSVSEPLMYLAYILLLVGALAKAGAIPFHTWVPAAAEGAPTSVMAFLPASLDKLLGIYFLALISLKVFAIDEVIQLLLLIVGAVTVLAAVMIAMIQHDLKKLLSYHAVSQVGYMVLGIGTGLWIGVIGGLFHMVNHAIYKCCLFLCAGSVERRAGTTDLDRLGGLGRVMPATFLTCGIAALAISGVPPLNGFVSKWMVYQGLLASPLKLAPIALVAAVFGSALTLASFVKVLHAVFMGPMSSSAAAREPREANGWMLVPMILLAVSCIVLGVVYTVPTNDILGPILEESGVTLTKTEVGGLWQPGTALLLTAIGLAAGLALYQLGKAFKPRRTRIYVGGELLPSELSRVSGTEFYGTVRQLPVLAPLYKDAERKAFDIYRWGERYGGSLVAALRGFHSGLLPLYVSWCLLGLMILIAFLVQGK